MLCTGPKNPSYRRLVSIFVSLHIGPLCTTVIWKKRNRKIYFSLYRLVVEVLISYFYEWSTSFVNKRLLRLNCKRNGTKVVARLEKDKYCSKSRNSFTKRALTLQLFCNLVATGHCYWKQWGREVSVEVLFHKQPCFQGEKEKISAVVLVYLHLFSFTI